MNERLARAFMDEGHQVRIVTFTLQYPDVLFPGKSQTDDRPKPPFVIERCINSINPFNWIRVGMAIRRMKPDLIVVKYWIPFMAPCFGTILRLARSNKHTRAIAILDNLIPHEKRPFDRAFTRYFVDAVDGFVALSRSVLNDIDLFDKSRPRLFNPHPVYDHFGEPLEPATARKELQLNPSGKYILFFGFIRDYKGLDLLLKAMPLIQTEGVKLIIAGEFYNNEKNYQKLIDELGVRDRVVLHTSFIPDERVRYYFSAADVVVQPYKTATQSGVTQIAYHFEKPMIVTNVGGLPEMVPHQKAGFVCDADPGAIARAIDDFYQCDPGSFVPTLRAKQVEYSWKTMVNNILGLVES
ncbi:MAG: glycosyltransferase family 4 protein [Salibacteraceae bacterium]